jgi:hypothetical protein
MKFHLMLVFQSRVGVSTTVPVELSVPTPLRAGSERNIDQSALTNGGKARLVAIIMQNMAATVFLMPVQAHDGVS